jgi:hypothetical protein
MLEDLVPLCRDRATIRVLDVDAREDWRRRYGDRVPVLCAGDQELSVARLDRDAFLRFLAGKP